MVVITALTSLLTHTNTRVTMFQGNLGSCLVRRLLPEIAHTPPTHTNAHTHGTETYTARGCSTSEQEDQAPGYELGPVDGFVGVHHGVSKPR